MSWLLIILLAASEDGVPVGPEAGQPIPELKTHQVVGSAAGKEVDWKTEAQKQPTLLLFIRSDSWDRPLARVLRQVDQAIAGHEQKADAKPAVSIIWVTKETNRGKDYLPRAQESLKLQASTWNIFSGEVFDAQGWVLSGDDPLNAIMVKDKKIAWGRAYKEINDDLARTIMRQVRGDKK